jgi:hypothetical protein
MQNRPRNRIVAFGVVWTPILQCESPVIEMTEGLRNFCRGTIFASIQEMMVAIGLGDRGSLSFRPLVL